MVKILVTGGLGFIGSNFIQTILRDGKPYLVLNLDSETYGANRNNLSAIHNLSSYTFVRADLRDDDAVNKFVGQVDVIVNFAAETHVDRSISSPGSFVQSNVGGTFNLLEAGRKEGIQKFVHISTDEVYGSAAVDGSFTELDRLNPSSPYAASKAAADMLVQAYNKTYGMHTIILRCTNNFGPYQSPEKFIPKTIINALRGCTIPIYGDGKQIRDWVYVSDFCSAVEMALEHSSAGSVYNVSSGNGVQNIELARLMLQKLNKPSELLQLVEDRPGHDSRYSIDSRKIRNDLGWSPAYNFNDALSETVDWYVRNEAWWKPLATEKLLSPTPWKETW